MGINMLDILKENLERPYADGMDIIKTRITLINTRIIEFRKYFGISVSRTTVCNWQKWDSSATSVGDKRKPLEDF